MENSLRRLLENVFNSIQYFLSFNYQLLPTILNKASFNSEVLSFFFNYLISKKTQYLWNSFIFPFFCIDIEVEQDSLLSPILTVLYLSSVFYIFKKRTNNLKIPISFLSFVNNRLFISQEKSFGKTNSILFYSYNIISSLLEQFELIIEYRKSEIFYFSRLYSLFNPSLLDFSQFGDFILKSKYLEIFRSYIQQKITTLTIY